MLPLLPFVQTADGRVVADLVALNLLGGHIVEEVQSWKVQLQRTKQLHGSFKY